MRLSAMGSSTVSITAITVSRADGVNMRSSTVRHSEVCTDKKVLSSDMIWVSLPRLLVADTICPLSK